MVPDQIMHKGKTGLFGAIESAANLRNSLAFAALTAILLALSALLHFTVPENGDLRAFLWSSAAMLAVSLAELAVIRRKKGAGVRLKWVIGISYIVSAVLTTATMGAAGSILFVFPMLLSIPYCSVLYSLFISAATGMSAFVPLLLSARLSSYDLNAVRLAPGTVLRVDTTLEAALGPAVIDAAGTKANELLSTYLPVILFVNLIAVVTVAITAALRKSLLQRYRQFQTTRE